MRQSALAVSIVLLLACGPSHASGSYDEEADVPTEVTPPIDWVVRPDVLRVAFVFTATEGDPAAATPRLKNAVEELTRKIKEVSGGAAVVRMRRAEAPAQREKGRGLRVEGEVEASLAAEADFWSRSRLLSALENIFAEAKTRHGGSARILFSFSAPEAGLRNPEMKRGELTALWLKNTRDFADAVQSKQLPLHVVDCSPAPRVVVTPISLEEVGVSLQVTCRLDAIRSMAR